MKNKYIFIMGLMLLTLLSVTAIYAETTDVGDSTFTIPEGYTVANTTSDQVSLTNETSYIIVYEGPILDLAEAKQKRIAAGYTLIGEETYDADGVEMNQQNYHSDDGVTTCIYTFEKNNKTYIITFSLLDTDEVPEHENNPVTEILDTLK